MLSIEVLARNVVIEILKDQVVRRIQFISFFILFCLQAAANESKIDSLLLRLKSRPTGNQLMELYLALANNYYPNDLSNAKKYGQQAFAISSDLGEKKGIGESLFVLGKIEGLNHPEVALGHYFEAVEIFNELGDKLQLAKTFNNVGIIHKNLGKYRIAFDYYSKSYELFEETGNVRGMSQALGNIGVLYRRQAEYEKAIDFFIRSLRLKESLDDELGIAITYGNIGNLHKDQGNLNEALEFHQKALQGFQRLNRKLRSANTLNNIGIIYEDLGDFNQALDYYQKALKINSEMDYRRGMGLVLNNIGSVFDHQGRYQSSLANYTKALEIFRDLDEGQNIAEGLIDIAVLNIKLEDYDNCYPILIEGLELAKTIGNKKIEIDGLNALSDYYEAVGDYSAAFEAFRRYESLKDSVFNLQKTEQIREIQTRYETEKKDQENALLNSVIRRQNVEKAALIVGSILLLLFSMYFYRTTLQKKRTNKLLAKKQEEVISINRSLEDSQQKLHSANEELKKLNHGLESTVKERTHELQISNKELDTFLYQSSHALRRPIVSVLGLLQLARMEPSPKNIADVYQKIERTATGMDKMLKKLAMASEINHGVHEPAPVVFAEILPELRSNLKAIENGTPFDVSWEIGNGIDYQGDQELLEMVLEYLMENAIYFHGEVNGETPTIRIRINRSLDAKCIIIRVYDNGMGVPEEVRNRIFDMFTVGTDIPSGNGYGLGLYLVKKALAKMGGSISLRSEERKYSEFTISLPISPLVASSA